MKRILQAGDKPSKSLTPRRRHVKSGCRTCKIRKVKCDEGRPSCNRCISTGRTCDGYGVWGGGGNYYGQHSSQSSYKLDSASPWRPACASELVDDSKDTKSFEWFICRTAKKIPGIFTLAFWESLLLPASLSQPAILHALLCVSYVHRDGTLAVEQGAASALNDSSSEQLLLQHYVMATAEVRRSSQHSDGSHSTLIACILFAYLEFLRGHFRTARRHIDAGLKILQDTQNDYSVLDERDGSLLVVHSQSEVDDGIRDAFLRLYVQIQLLSAGHSRTELYLLPSPSERPSFFSCLNDAWQQLERIFCDIFLLEHWNIHQQMESAMALDLATRQVSIERELFWWSMTFDRSATRHNQDERAAIAGPVLTSYHAMATVMANTCLSTDEMIYDRFTNLFIKIIASCTGMWKARAPTALPNSVLNMSRSVVDIGWIPPLYYTAIKCRINRVRLHAIRLLECTSHREGIWDARIGAEVARTVMQIETRSDSVEDGCKFELDDMPSLESLVAARLPENDSRVSELEVILPDGMDENVVLRYMQGSYQQERAIRLG